jgi:hypothetical protein
MSQHWFAVYRRNASRGSPVQSISDDASRYLGENSSFAIAEHMHTELLQHLELQQQTSTVSRYHELVAESNTKVMYLFQLMKIFSFISSDVLFLKRNGKYVQYDVACWAYR